MFSPMNMPPGTPGGFGAATMYSPFPPGHPNHPGAPPGHVIVHPMSPRADRPHSAENEEQAESPDNKLLKQIWLGITKIASATKRNEQSLRDITGRQSNIEDRLSLMDQRVMRIGSRVDEIFESGKGHEEAVKSAAADVANVSSEIMAVKAVVDGFTIDKVEASTQELMQQVKTLTEGMEQLKTLVTAPPVAAAPPPVDVPVEFIPSAEPPVPPPGPEEPVIVAGEEAAAS